MLDLYTKIKKLDHAQMKENELVFQNRKYGKNAILKESYKTSVEEIEHQLLTPYHLCGKNRRGLMFQYAVRELLKNDIKGKRILDYCCGTGSLGIFLAMKGAHVCGFDFSEKAIERARCKAEVNNIDVDFKVMDAEKLLYPDGYFDFVIGFEALHHVIIHPRVPSELARILRSGGTVIFAENWGGSNPFFQLWRSLTTLRRNRSSDRGEVILYRDLLQKNLGTYFSRIDIEAISLLYMSKKFISNRSILQFLFQVDNILVTIIPFLKNYCGESIIKLKI